jgi:hypothetical protein
MNNDGRSIVVATQEELANLIMGALRAGFAELHGYIREAEAEKRGKKLLDTVEVAAEYGIGKRILERWRYEGVGPSYTVVGRRVYYEREVLDKFFADGRVQTTGRVQED